MCLYPCTIQHPKYRHDLKNGRVAEVYIKGESQPIESYYSAEFYGVTALLNNLHEAYYIRTDGEKRPIFLSCPCRKCHQCLEQKRSSYKNRMLLEAKMHEDYSKPVHLTLTYNDKCLPSSGVSPSDLSKFFNRLNTYLPRYGYDFKVSYAGFSEYSPEKHRPHYHVVLFGIPKEELTYVFKSNDCSYWKFVNFLRKCWPFGFVKLNVNFPPRKLKYVCKYACKDSIVPVPEGKHPNFVRLSNFLGCPKANHEELLQIFQYKQRVDLKILGEVHSVCFPATIRHRFDYSFKAVMGHSAYRAMQRLRRLFCLMKRNDYFSSVFEKEIHNILDALSRKYYPFDETCYFNGITPTRFDDLELLREYTCGKFLSENAVLPLMKQLSLILNVYHYDVAPFHRLAEVDSDTFFKSFEEFNQLADYLLNLDLDYSKADFHLYFRDTYADVNEDYFRAMSDANAGYYNHADEWNAYYLKCLKNRATLNHDEFLDDYATNITFSSL